MYSRRSVTAIANAVHIVDVTFVFVSEKSAAENIDITYVRLASRRHLRALRAKVGDKDRKVRPQLHPMSMHLIWPQRGWACGG